MATFKDSTGAEWPMRRITVGALDDLATLGLDVEAVVEDFNRLSAVVAKPRAFAKLLWWFVGDAVTESGLSPGAFNDRLDGDTMYAALCGIRDAIVESFPHPPAAKARAIARLSEVTAGGGSAAASTSSPPSPASTPTG